jgi:murein DD-endopeptidase MepM/ murein hydrolase activator NlpD
MLGRPSAQPSRPARLRAARAALARARGLAPELTEAPALERPDALDVARTALGAARPRLARHITLLALVALVLAGEVSGAWSRRAAGSPEAPLRSAAAPAWADGASVIGAPGGPVAIGPIRLGPAGEPMAPALSRPVEVASAFQTTHQLAAEETLGAVAERYSVSIESLVWANGLEQGDALVAGQLLRIPHVSGVAYTVAEGDTAAGLAQRFGVPLEAIVTFPANRIDATLRLPPGREIFIPGARPELPADWLGAVGGIEGLGNRKAEQAAVVRAAETNLRVGPSTDHPRVAQLNAGRRLALRARNGDWLQVELGPLRGWIRSDMVEARAEEVAALPISNDFPAPPPRWVWPARGTLTSGFGPRWRSFHNGIDIANRAWTPIVAARSGRVKEAGWCSGYGYCVKITHADGMETVYGHLIAKPVVARGDEVSAGDLIGNMGSTYDRAGGGFSTGVHLHFTVLVNGKAVNPLKYLP